MADARGASVVDTTLCYDTLMLAAYVVSQTFYCTGCRLLTLLRRDACAYAPLMIARAAAGDTTLPAAYAIYDADTLMPLHVSRWR